MQNGTLNPTNSSLCKSRKIWLSWLQWKKGIAFFYVSNIKKMSDLVFDLLLQKDPINDWMLA